MDNKQSLNSEYPKQVKQSLKVTTINSIWGIVFLLAAVIVSFSFIDLAGIAGQKINEILYYFFGYGKFLLPVSFLVLSVSFFLNKINEVKKITFLGFIIFILSFLGLFESSMQGVRAGGILGQISAFLFLKLFGVYATFLILFAFLFIGILISFNINLSSLKEIFKISKISNQSDNIEQPKQLEAYDNIKNVKEEIIFKISKISNQSDNTEKLKQLEAYDNYDNIKNVKEEIIFKKPPFLNKVFHLFSDSNQSQEQKKVKEKSEAKKIISRKKIKIFTDYPPPPLTLLDDVSVRPSSGDISGNKNIIKRTLADFGIAVEMDEVHVGPTVTQYTLKPASGINLSRIISLRKNLSLALAADPIRIEAPIPGKSLVGIEIPNKSAAQVRLRGLLKRMSEEGFSSHLVLPLGRDVSGEPVFVDLTKMPHLLIAGATGSGKSICINNIILSLLYFNSPKTLRLILIDPKRVEMTPYNGVSLLLTPVIVEPKEAVNALRWAVREMENRYKILSEAGFRDIISYNEHLLKENSSDTMYYIIIIIDELADLMASYKKEVEAAVVRLAQMARAVGIHLIASTQRPSVEVVTGLIKANITTRIAFKVASQIDSRTILDQAGAEKLLGAGDMLFMSGGASGLKRIQGTYVSDEEVKRVVAYLASVTAPEYRLDITQNPQESVTITGNEGQYEDDDVIYEEVKNFVIQTQKASASLIQRRFRVGYARAARILDMLEAEGIIGPVEGAKPRKVLVSSDQINKL